ncbi:RNA 2',3'-cyclic phosphodiesterase [Kiloniella laminariae]|uniref:RNA 2',3'-cyclic phosphodiesterase n=1 Tax=Kiloniella laminariae TaxID=454162 RepID=A0ABT4LJD0_9PROT|nr:RNA 2',3'-cyclic phosphodiesterase [Kiloniella laminariae]MCZ4281040.1 RNA 2',3'-cyclic phosphodiesterase [Kiloniella laminariae]
MRLFSAIALPEEARLSLMGLCHGLPGQRWVVPENFHITLRFFGEVNGAVARDLDEVFSRIHFKPFEVRLSGVGAFGKENKPRMLWAGVEKTPEISDLKRKIEHAAQSVGVNLEREKFTPHVTLCRFKSAPGPAFGNYLQANSLFSHPPFVAECFGLYSSHLTPSGACYALEADYPEPFFSWTETLDI